MDDDFPAASPFPHIHPRAEALLQLGLQPNYMTDDVIAAMLEKVIKYKSKIEPRKILPRVSWNKSARS